MSELEQKLQDSIIELGKKDLTLAYQIVAGSMVGLAELIAKQQGHNPELKINLVGGTRKITIHEKES
jgi:hypothetical protein